MPYRLALAVLLLAGCTSAEPDADAIRGIWLLESFAVGGATEQVELGANTADPPWVEIGATLRGDAGCNHFETMSEVPYSYEEGLLFAGEGFHTEIACRGNDGEDLMEVERLFIDTLWGSPVGIRVEVVEGSMTWRAGNSELFFTRVPTPPEPTSTPPPATMGRLNCSPGIVVETQVVDDPRPTEEVLLDIVPQVASTEEDPDFAPSAPADWFYWGYDAAGNTIAFIARGDVEPPQYQVFTCAF